MLAAFKEEVAHYRALSTSEMETLSSSPTASPVTVVTSSGTLGSSPGHLLALVGTALLTVNFMSFTAGLHVSWLLTQYYKSW